MDQPKVLLICGDRRRADGVPALGHPDAKTPNPDALVAESV